MPFDSEITTKSRDLIVLEKARERIASGWCQNRRWDQEGNVCLLGAIADATHTRVGNPGNVEALVGAMGFTRSSGPISPILQAVEWNNKPGRTQAEVLARFDAAIEKLSNA